MTVRTDPFPVSSPTLVCASERASGRRRKAFRLITPAPVNWIILEGGSRRERQIWRGWREKREKKEEKERIERKKMDEHKPMGVGLSRKAL